MFEKYVSRMVPYIKEIRDKIDSDGKAIVNIKDIHTVLDMYNESYSKSLSIIRYILKPVNIEVSTYINNSNEVLLIFKYSINTNDKRNVYIGEETCGLCGSIDTGSEHHIIPRRFGGKNIRSNLIFLCVNCHNNAEMLCSYCQNSRNICNIYMFNRCWRNDNINFLQTEESKEEFSDISKIPAKYISDNKFNTTRGRKKVIISSYKCSICKRKSYNVLNCCELTPNSMIYLGKRIIRSQDISNKNIVYMCDSCFNVSLSIQNQYLKIKGV